MRENRTSGSMSGSEKPSHGRAIEALPEETGSQRIGPAYRHGARVRLYRTRRSWDALADLRAEEVRLLQAEGRYPLRAPGPEEGWPHGQAGGGGRTHEHALTVHDRCVLSSECLWDVFGAGAERPWAGLLLEG